MPADALDQRYEAAYERGARDLPLGEDPPERPIMLLATAIPRLISLAVAANVLHLLPTGTHDGAALIATIDATATGSLHRCHLALQSDGESRGYDTDEWLPLAYEQAADWLEHASGAADPPPAIEHAQQAGRLAALAIGALDRDAPTAPETIADCLAHLLFTCVFADAAAPGKPGSRSCMCSTTWSSGCLSHTRPRRPKAHALTRAAPREWRELSGYAVTSGSTTLALCSYASCWTGSASSRLVSRAHKTAGRRRERESSGT